MRNLFRGTRPLLAKSFLFYDFETTGLSHVDDRAVRFAAIRTNSELKELERHEISMRLPSSDIAWLIPHRFKWQYEMPHCTVYHVRG